MAAVTLVVGNQARAQLCQNSIAVRVSPAGFSFVVEEIRGLIPDRIDIPSISAVVMDWPLTDHDARVEMGPNPGVVTLHGMDFVMVNRGALRMRMTAGIHVSGLAVVSNAYGGFGSDRCQVDLQLPRVQFEADFELQTYGNHIRVELSAVRASSNDQQRVVRISDCAIGEIYQALSNTLGKETEVGTQQWLEEFARVRVPPLLEQALRQSLDTSVLDRPLRFQAELRDAQTSAEGLVLRADVGVEPTTQGFAGCLAASAPPLPPPCETAAPPPVVSDAMYAVSFSEGLINRALHATWRSGMLCIDSSRLELPEIAETVENLSPTLGLAPGSRVSFQVTPLKPPLVQFSQRDGARLMFDDLELRLQLSGGAEGPSGSLQLRASFSVAAIPTLEQTTNSLGFTLGSVGVRQLQIGQPGQPPSPLQLDPARLQRFISDVVLPLLRRQIERSQLTPSVVQAQSYLLALRNVFVADGYVSLQGDAHRPSAVTDRTPPDTQLLEAPKSLVGPQILPLKVSGVDAQTPSALLRFQVRVDGGAWSKARFGGSVDVVAHGGQHQVEIAAVDLQGNADPTPLTVSLIVDDISPEVQVTTQPADLINEEQFSVSFIARDDRTPPGSIRFTSELIRVQDEGGALEVIERRELARGTNTAQFSAPGEGLYRARITAHDEAGNVGSKEVGVIVQDAGCTAGPASARRTCIVLVLLLAFWARGRRPGQRVSGSRAKM
jgi:hypothetical protein